MAARQDQAEPRPAQESPTAQKSPPLDRNTANLLYNELTEPEGLRRFYDFHMAAYNEDKHEYFAHECTLLTADIELELMFVLRTPEGSYFEQHATCQVRAGHENVFLDFYPLPKDQAREEFPRWPLKTTSLEEAFGASAQAEPPDPEGGAA